MRKTSEPEKEQMSAPARIRNTAKICKFLGVLAIILPGAATLLSPLPEFGADAYTEIVSHLARVNLSIAWLAAVVLLVGCGVLNALADILDGQHRGAEPIAGTQ